MDKPSFLPATIAYETEERRQEPIFRWYAGIDIGYKFHEAACIPFEVFCRRNDSWKRTKTLKFNSDSEGIHALLEALAEASPNPKEFCVLMEPTGGFYGFVVMKVLQEHGYNVFYVENKGVKDFREKTLGIAEKTDRIDAKVMAYMGWHKELHPELKNVRLVNPEAPAQAVFKALVADRWSLNKQLTRRKNQLQQIFSVTNPELKSVFTSGTATKSMRRLVTKYPSGQDMAKATEEELRQALVSAGARSVAAKKSGDLKALLDKTQAISIPHFIRRQNMLIQDMDRIEAIIAELDIDIKELVDSHPWKDILWSFPVMSYTWACTIIGSIGDVDRFSNYKQFKRYVGFSSENKKSGTSVHSTRLSYSGVRETRRVLFQMVMTMLTPNAGDNVFKIYFNALVERKMVKMKAMGHVAGKFAQVLYGCLKKGELYNREIHARGMGMIRSDEASN
jgi:transposase